MFHPQISTTVTRTLASLALTAAGVLYTTILGFPGVEASSSTSTAPSATTQTYTGLSTTVPTGLLSVYSTWHCGILHQWCSSTQRSAAMRRLTSPDLWLVLLVAVAYYFMLANGAFTTAPRALGGDEVATSTTLATPAVQAKETTFYRRIAGHRAPYKIEIKLPQPTAKPEESDPTETVVNADPGVTKLVILLFLFVITAMLLPMAIAEPTQTCVPTACLTLPSPTPAPTVFNVTATNTTLELEQKDKPQSWFWPPIASPGTSISAFSIVILLVIIGHLLVPALAESTQTTIPTASLTLGSSTPVPTVFNATLDLEQKDRPQSWFWHPNASAQTSMRSLLLLIPLLVMGYFIAPTLATQAPETTPSAVTPQR